MNPAIKTQLLRWDEKDAYEFPSEFNAQALEQRAGAVYEALKAMNVSCSFETWLHNQDASFGLAIILAEYQQKNINGVFQPAIRFSNFGNLATLTTIEGIPTADLQRVFTLLRQYQFSYLPADELDSEYDGVMAETAHFATWWIRYFDYL